MEAKSNDNPTISVQKEVKEGDIFNDIVKYMNNQRDVTLLLYSWKLLGIRNATYALMKSINKEGFVLDVTIGQKCESHSYKFNKPLKDATESRKVLMNLHEKSSFVSWPTGIVPLIVLIGYALAFLAIIPYQDLMSIEILETLKEYSLKYIFGSSTTASVVLIATLVAHTIEAMYTYYLCTQHIKLSRANSLTWVSLCLLIGYPVTSDVIYLSKVATKKNK